jgi:hypothetical protein
MTREGIRRQPGLVCRRLAAVGIVTAGVLGLGPAAAGQGAPPPVQGRGGGTPQAGQPQQPAAAPATPPNTGPVPGPGGAAIGYTNMAEIPGTPWRIHDAARPQPAVVAPGVMSSDPPSDAIVLFGGKDLSHWVHVRQGQRVAAEWPVFDGYFETGAGRGSIVTRENFGSVQLHVEYATPATVAGNSQGRGNSGVILMGRYEVQVLDSFENPTYADGMAGSIYGEYPPLVNAARKPGAWQSYDIVFEAPLFKGSTLVRPAYLTVFWNGVLVQLRRPVMGSTSATMQPHSYTAHDAELPLTLQDHSNPVRYRNVWIRRLAE